MKFLKGVSKNIRYKLRATGLRTPLVWMRHRGLEPHDTFLASYPRSGNTWMRFLLAEVLANRAADFGSVRLTIPDLRRLRGAPRLVPGGGRLIRTHENYCWCYRKAIYIVRDPRDVAISNFDIEWTDATYPGGGFDGFVKEFVRGKANPHKAWQKHVWGWLHSPLVNTGNLLLIRYEDMHADVEKALARTLEFIGVPAEPELIRKAVKDNNLTRMREKEDGDRRATGVIVHGERVNGYGRHVGTGVVGGWRARLTDEQVELLENHAGDLLATLGYPTRYELETGEATLTGHSAKANSHAKLGLASA
jgi:hypothetical protein